MEKVSDRKRAVLDVLDEQIGVLEKKLVKVQPLVDELAQLRKTRATLLSERSVTGGVRDGTRITMEMVIHALREAGGSATVADLATEVGVTPGAMRAHLNRFKDERYRKDGDEWELIGEDEEEDEDDGDED